MLAGPSLHCAHWFAPLIAVIWLSPKRGLRRIKQDTCQTLQLPTGLQSRLKEGSCPPPVLGGVSVDE